MKLLAKITTYTLAFIAFTLTACTAYSEPAQPLTNFTATVTCNSEEYTVVHSGSTLTTVTYCTPQQLNGLTYIYKNDILSVNYLSLSYTPSNNTVPATNNATQLYEILKSVSGNNCYIMSTSEDTATYSLPTAQMLCDLTTGRIKEIKPKSGNSTYLFSYKE